MHSIALHSIALYFMHYNFCCQHKSLGGIRPAMATGVSVRLLGIGEIVRIVEAEMPKPDLRGPFKKRNSN